MNFTLSEDNEALRDSAQAFLSKEVDLTPLKRPDATVEQAGYDRLWPKIVELGWPSVVIPEAYGGLGMTYLDLAMIIGEMGRTLAPSPLFGTLAGAWAIEKGGSQEQKQRLLGAVVAGEMKLALAFADESGTEKLGVGVLASKGGADWRLSGVRSFVVDALAADKIVVAAQVDGATRFFVVDRFAPGVTVELLPWRDITRQVCKVTLRDAASELLAESGADTWPWVRDRLYLMLAAESAAGIEATLQAAVEYAKQRVAFGRPIGFYQSIKHQLAEIAGQSTCATAGVQYAAWALSEGDPKASLACTMVQGYASDAYREASYRNIQVHGAIGFTWEMPNHLYYKRARCNAELLGSSRHQREQIMQMIEANPALAA